MTNFEKIKEGMKLIKEGCKENTTWTACSDCPFDDYCTLIMQANAKEGLISEMSPSEWELED